mgnify:CR=1 FL=1
MYKIIRIRVHGNEYCERTVTQGILTTCGKKIKLIPVTGVQMERAVDINCVLLGGMLTRLVTLAKFIWKLANLRSEDFNVEIIWGV